MGGELFLNDVSGDEEGEARRRLIRSQDTAWIDIHASREARWQAVDVAGTRPIVVFALLKRFLCTGGFSVRLVWGRPDRRRGVFRTAKPPRCPLERPQMLTDLDLRMLGLERPDSQPVMTPWTTSPCHAAIVDWSATSESWVHGWDAGHPGLLAQLFVEWEITGDEGHSFAPLHEAVKAVGPRAVVMYLLATRYGELLAPIGDGLAMAKQQVKRIDASLERLRPGEPSPPALAPHREAFEEALADDLDTPSAFLALFDWIREAKTLHRLKAGDQDLRKMLWTLGMVWPLSRDRAAASRATLPARGPA